MAARPEQKISLFFNKKQKFVPANAYLGLSDQNLRELEKAQEIASSKRAGHAPQDAHWDWEDLVRQVQPDDRVWVVEKFELLPWHPRTQGTVIFGPSRSALAPSAPLVEVHFLSTMLHNRNKVDKNNNIILGRYRGVGTSLMHLAAEYSRQLGHQGRIGLYALSKAHAFYSSLNLQIHPTITKENGALVYFEGTL